MILLNIFTAEQYVKKYLDSCGYEYEIVGFRSYNDDGIECVDVEFTMADYDDVCAMTVWQEGLELYGEF